MCFLMKEHTMPCSLGNKKIKQKSKSDQVSIANNLWTEKHVKVHQEIAISRFQDLQNSIAHISQIVLFFKICKQCTDTHGGDKSINKCKEGITTEVRIVRGERRLWLGLGSWKTSRVARKVLFLYFWCLQGCLPYMQKYIYI